MGQEESKQKIQQIMETVEKIWKDVKDGKIASKKRENYLKDLVSYIDELETKYKMLRSSPIYSHIMTIINDAKEQLNTVGTQEAESNSATGRRNSLKRSISKTSKEMKHSVKTISDAVDGIKKNINEQITIEEHLALQKMIVGYSIELYQFQGQGKNKNEIYAARNKISLVMQKLLTKQIEDNIDLSSIRTSFIEDNLNHQNYKQDKELNHEVSVENVSPELEMEKKLIEAEREHFRFLSESSSFDETLDSDSYEKCKLGLQDLRILVSQISEISQKVADKKKYVIYNIDSSLISLEQNAKEKYVINTLEPSSTHNFAPTREEEERQFIEELEDLKDKVCVYSGTYKNVLYRAIEKGLNKCLCDVDYVFNDEDVVLKLKKDIEENILILKQKCNESVATNEERRKSNAETKHDQAIEDKRKSDENSDSGSSFPLKQQTATKTIDASIPKNRNMMKLTEVQESVDTSEKLLKSNGGIKQTILTLDNKQDDSGSEALKSPFIKQHLTTDTTVDSASISTNRNMMKLTESKNPNALTGRKLDELNNLQNNCLAEETRNLEEDITCRSSSIKELDPASIKQQITTQTTAESASMLTNRNMYKLTEVKEKLTSSKEDDQETEKIRKLDEHHSSSINEELTLSLTKQENTQTSPGQSDIRNRTTKVNEIMQKVESTKRELNSPNPLTYEELINLNNKLTRYILTLDSMKDEQRKDAQKKIHQDINSYSSRIQQPTQESVLANQASKQQIVEIENTVTNAKCDVSDRNNKKLAQIRENVEIINMELNNSVCLSQEELDKVDDTLTLLILKLDNLKDDQVKEERKTIYHDIRCCFSRIQELQEPGLISQSSRQPVADDDENIVPSVVCEVTVRHTKKFGDVRNNIDFVKKELSNPTHLTYKQLDKLDGKLALSILTLDSIKDDQLKAERKELYEDINSYVLRIQELMMTKQLVDEEIDADLFNK